MNDPVIFISTFMEAAIFGRMKVDVLRGTVEEMDAALLEIVDRKRSTPMIIFCRDAEEIDKVRGMLSKVMELKRKTPRVLLKVMVRFFFPGYLDRRFIFVSPRSGSLFPIPHSMLFSSYKVSPFTHRWL